MELRHRLVNYKVLLHDIFSNMNKTERMNEFNNKLKKTLYTFFEEYVRLYGGESSLVLIYLVL